MNCSPCGRLVLAERGAAPVVYSISGALGRQPANAPENGFITSPPGPSARWRWWPCSAEATESFETLARILGTGVGEARAGPLLLPGTSIESVPNGFPQSLDRRELAAALATLGLLVGLVGMHVLGLHGAHHDASSAQLGTAPSVATQMAVPGGLVERHTPTNTQHAELVPECCDHGPGASALMLCLALLVTSGLLAALALGSSLRRAGGVRRPNSGPSWLIASPARAGPPYLMAFSVIRC